MRALLRRLALSPLAAGALLMLAALDLCMAVWLEMAAFSGIETAVVTTPQPARTSRQEKTASAPKLATDYQATLARPVFFKTRLPYLPPPPALPPLVSTVEAPPPPPPSVPEPNLTLAGEGEEIQGWQVRIIGAMWLAGSVPAL